MALGWKAQDLYNEYVETKDSLLYARNAYDNNMYFTGVEYDGLSDNIATLEERLSHLLDQLKLEGVDLKDLLLLSAGVDVELFK